ncbi:MAG: hypothetical protein HYW07_07285 [Candidatus Latescibacteria bacterium]|nr:hypothetical protein [Candidatus Latescibacterota bacterium]
MSRFALVSLLLGALGAGRAGTDQYLLYKEANLAAFYSPRAGGLHSSPEAPLSALGFEYFWKSLESVPGQWRASVLDLYFQLAYDPGKRHLVLRARDIWLRFEEPRTGAQVRLGHFDLPFGLTSPLALRGQALRPLSELSLGFAQDWGLSAHGRWGHFEYEAAATLGSGEELRLRPGAALWTGRLGLPSYRKVQYGISLLYGNPFRPGQQGTAPASWRVAVDGLFIYHEPFTSLKGEVDLGADQGRLAGGLLLGLTQILPADPHWGLEGQVRLWRSAGTRGELVAGLLRSLPGLFTFRFHWRYRSAALGGSGLFAQLYYYGP